MEIEIIPFTEPAPEWTFPKPAALSDYDLSSRGFIRTGETELWLAVSDRRLYAFSAHGIATYSGYIGNDGEALVLSKLIAELLHNPHEETLTLYVSIQPDTAAIAREIEIVRRKRRMASRRIQDPDRAIPRLWSLMRGGILSSATQQTLTRNSATARTTGCLVSLHVLLCCGTMYGIDRNGVLLGPDDGAIVIRNGLAEWEKLDPDNDPSYDEYDEILDELPSQLGVRCFEISRSFGEDEDEDEVPHYHSRNREWEYREVPQFALGFELELSFNSCGAREGHMEDAEQAISGLICEDDSSLKTGHSIETISPPHPLSKICGIATEVCDIANEYGASVPGRIYGLHVSIDRAGFTELHVAKFAAWWHLNEDIVYSLARREATEYCCNYKYEAIRQGKPVTHPKQFGHGAAVNCRDDSRLEVRVFRATTRPERLRASIQLVHAVAGFTKECPASLDGVTDMPAFWRFVHERARREYPDLIQYAISRGVDVRLSPRRLESIKRKDELKNALLTDARPPKE